MILLVVGIRHIRASRCRMGIDLSNVWFHINPVF
jgi:hypothetical protein